MSGPQTTINPYGQGATPTGDDEAESVPNSVIDALIKKANERRDNQKGTLSEGRLPLKVDEPIHGACRQCKNTALVAFGIHDKRDKTAAGLSVSWYKVVIDCSRCDYSKMTEQRFKIHDA